MIYLEVTIASAGHYQRQRRSHSFALTIEIVFGHLRQRGVPCVEIVMNSLGQ